MRTLGNTRPGDCQSVLYTRCTVDLASAGAEFDEVPCENLEDVLGGFGRSFQMLADLDIRDAFADENPLIVNTGLLTGSGVMTGLRSYFSSYSPIKTSNQGLPGAIWSAASGKFGSKLKWTGVDELVFSRVHNNPSAEGFPRNHIKSQVYQRKRVSAET